MFIYVVFGEDEGQQVMLNTRCRSVILLDAVCEAMGLDAGQFSDPSATLTSPIMGDEVTLPRIKNPFDLPADAAAPNADARDPPASNPRDRSASRHPALVFLDLADEAGNLRGLNPSNPLEYASDVLKPRAKYVPVKIVVDQASSTKTCIPLRAGFELRTGSSSVTKAAKRPNASSLNTDTFAQLDRHLESPRVRTNLDASATSAASSSRSRNRSNRSQRNRKRRSTTITKS